MDVRVTNALRSYALYAVKTIWPAHLSAFYPYPQNPQMGAALVALAVLIAITVTAAAVRRRHPYALMGWLWFLITLTPVIGLIQVGDQSMADRYTYVPLLGLFVVLVWGGLELASRITNGAREAGVASMAILLALGAATRAQVLTWSDNDHLWQQALAATTDNYRAHLGLADAFMDRGDAAAAVPEYERAMALVPSAAPVRNSLGLALTAVGRIDDAARAYAVAVRLDPSNADAHDNLGAMLARRGKTPEAIAEYRAAIGLDPQLALAHNNLGLALANSGQVDAGIAECLTALALKPREAQWHYQVAMMLESRGRKAEAIEHLRATLAIDANHALAKEALARIR